jgi:hypothetical protein
VTALYLAVFAVAVLIFARRRRAARSSPTSCADVANEARFHYAGDGRAIRDAQARWAREQPLITSESVIRVVQGARAEIAHAGASEAREVLDELEHQAAAHPEGVPGYVVAAGRVRFDELMRGNIQ